MGDVCAVNCPEAAEGLLIMVSVSPPPAALYLADASPEIDAPASIVSVLEAPLITIWSYCDPAVLPSRFTKSVLVAPKTRFPLTVSVVCAALPPGESKPLNVSGAGRQVQICGRGHVAVIGLRSAADDVAVELDRAAGCDGQIPDNCHVLTA